MPASGHVRTKGLHAQHGPACYKLMFRSCLTGFSRRVLSITDWSVGVGDRAIGALDAFSYSKSPDTPSLYDTGFSTTAVMVDTAQARLRNEIGENYIKQAFNVQDRVPVAAPAQELLAEGNPAAREELVEKLKIVRLDGDAVVVPLYPEQADQMPFTAGHP